MMQEVNPKETTRAYAFEMWMKAPMPMVTLFKTFDVTRLRRISRRRDLKFNMLLCWCIGLAASQVKEFYLLPVGSKLMRYDSLAVNTIVLNREAVRSVHVTYPIPTILLFSTPIICALPVKCPQPVKTTTSPTVWLSAHRHWRNTISTEQ